MSNLEVEQRFINIDTVKFRKILKNVGAKLINPKRSMPKEAFNVHGFSEEFLKDKETFDQVANDFISFIKQKKIIIILITIIVVLLCVIGYLWYLHSHCSVAVFSNQPYSFKFTKLK